MKQLVWFIIGLALGFCLGAVVAKVAMRGGEAESFIDTVTVVDTVRYAMPVPKDSAVVRYKTVITHVNDTLYEVVRIERIDSGSAVLSIPITQKVYEDSLYRAWVSGYEARLDSIDVYSRTQTITIVEKSKPKRWGLGVQAGVGANHKGFTPYVGVGVSYNLISF